jgi:hypothetical protein
MVLKSLVAGKGEAVGEKRCQRETVSGTASGTVFFPGETQEPFSFRELLYPNNENPQSS